MIRTTPTSTTTTPKRLAIGLLDYVTSLWATCTKQAKLAKRKLIITATSKTSLKSSSSPKKLLTTITNKAMKLHHKKRVGRESETDEEGFGNGGLWQRSILMGDKCQPLDFSGVIYYDSNGKVLNEMPMKSPRASPLTGYVYSSPGKRE